MVTQKLNLNIKLTVNIYTTLTLWVKSIEYLKIVFKLSFADNFK